MLYFAYGSNMSSARLQARTPSATPLGCYLLKRHDLRFHKSSHDGSGKCDAFYTQNSEDVIYGALFELNLMEKPLLDKAEGLGLGYDEKQVKVFDLNGASVIAHTYFATHIEADLLPYSWYLNHVLIGAMETPLPKHYIDLKIRRSQVIMDNDLNRDNWERAIHSRP